MLRAEDRSIDERRQIAFHAQIARTETGHGDKAEQRPIADQQSGDHDDDRNQPRAATAVARREQDQHRDEVDRCDPLEHSRNAPGGMILGSGRRCAEIASDDAEIIQRQAEQREPDDTARDLEPECSPVAVWIERAAEGEPQRHPDAEQKVREHEISEGPPVPDSMLQLRQCVCPRPGADHQDHDRDGKAAQHVQLYDTLPVHHRPRSDCEP